MNYLDSIREVLPSFKEIIVSPLGANGWEAIAYLDNGLKFIPTRGAPWTLRQCVFQISSSC